MQDGLLLEFIPLVIFFTVYKIYGIMQATFAMVCVSLLIMIWQFYKTRKLNKQQLISISALLFFSSLTLISGDSAFIKMKPTVIYSIFAAVLIYGLCVNKIFIKHLLGGVLSIPDLAWRKLSFLWVMFFVIAALLNEVIWRNLSEEAWVQFKVFGMLPVMLLFALIQGLVLRRYL